MEERISLGAGGGGERGRLPGTCAENNKPADPQPAVPKHSGTSAQEFRFEHRQSGKQNGEIIIGSLQVRLPKEDVRRALRLPRGEDRAKDGGTSRGLGPGNVRLKADSETAAGGLGVTLKRASRRSAALALQPGYRRLRGLHPPRHLCLGHAGSTPCFDHGRGERELLIERLVLAPIVWVLHPIDVKIVNARPLHRFVTSLALSRARSISRLGVFWTFLTNTGTTTTR